MPVSLSVVICTRDRPESLARCVGSVCRQSVRPAEIVIVDDGSLSEEWVRLLKRLADEAAIPLGCVRSGRRGLTAARNEGVRRATGDIVQFLDDDVEPDSRFLEEILRAYAADTDGVVAGVDAVLEDSPPLSRRARAFRAGYRLAGWWALPAHGVRRPARPALLRDAERYTAERYLSGAAMSFRRSLLLENPFDESLAAYALGEDREMSLRLGRTRWLVRARRAWARHHVEASARTDAYTLGRMVVRNYWSIVSRYCGRGMGVRVAVGYSLLVLGLVRLAFALGPNGRAHLREAAGMARGGIDLLFLPS